MRWVLYLPHTIDPKYGENAFTDVVGRIPCPLLLSLFDRGL